MDSLTEKQQALVTVAKVFYDRAEFTQYDQRSMDRLLQLTPRRRKRLPPEAGNSQYIHFLDCSGYTSAIYLTAFGYELPSDLTWIMVDQLENRVFYYEMTHEETIADVQRIKQQVFDLVQPGDLITWQRVKGSGHIIMCMGNGEYTECTTPPGQKNSYNYEECKNQIYERGIWMRKLEKLFPVTEEMWETNRGLFRENVVRFSIHRCAEVAGDILPQTKLRMGKAKDLWCAVENSAPGSVPAYPGETVDYTVIVRNQGEEEKQISITFAPPAGTVFAGEGNIEKTLQVGEEIRLTFTVTVEQDNKAISLDGPVVTVNDLIVYAHPVLLGRKMTDAQWEAVKKTTLEEIAKGATVVEAAARGYAPLGIQMDGRQKRYSWTYFCYHDSTAGDVLSRQPQKPFADLAVYGGFGGKNVITPEMTAVPGNVRTTHILPRDFLPGDVLLCMDDAFGDKAYSAFFDGERLIGSFEADGQTRTIEGEELEKFIDSLFGRFAFLHLRPSQGL